MITKITISTTNNNFDKPEVESISLFSNPKISVYGIQKPTKKSSNSQTIQIYKSKFLSPQTIQIYKSKFISPQTIQIYKSKFISPQIIQKTTKNFKSI